MLENLLDSIAQESAFRQIHTGTKLLLGLGSLLICLLSPSPLVPLLSGVVITLVLIIPARISPVVYGEILLGPAIFTGISIVVLLLLLGGGAVVWRFSPVTGITLTVTEDAIRESTLVLCRVFGCSASLFFMVLTTPMTDLFNGMKRLKIPIEVIDLMMIIYRYIFIVHNQAVEIWRAQMMRLGYNRPAEAIRSFSTLCGMLFISSWNAGEDLIHAMDCRCYNGHFPSMELAEPLRLRSLVPVIAYLAILCGMLLMTSSGTMRLL